MFKILQKLFHKTKRISMKGYLWFLLVYFYKNNAIEIIVRIKAIDFLRSTFSPKNMIDRSIGTINEYESIL